MSASQKRTQNDTRHRRFGEIKAVPSVVTSTLGKERRDGYVFVSWIGDHSPRHVHVYKDGRLVLKWDLDHGKVMKGRETRRLMKLIADLEKEQLL